MKGRESRREMEMKMNFFFKGKIFRDDTKYFEVEKKKLNQRC